MSLIAVSLLAMYGAGSGVTVLCLALGLVRPKATA
jgi:hypothetical protein